MKPQQKQTTSHILMIRPVHFGFNAETAVNNSFQVAGEGDHAAEDAVQEFDAFVMQLRAHDIDVLVVNDTPEPHTPDSIFPNNWISFHEDGTTILYPMFANNRRQERKPHVLEAIGSRFQIGERIDLTAAEHSGKFLEGTGSLVLDRTNSIAYACLSPRTDADVLDTFCAATGYRPVTFHAVDGRNTAIYHTNVMMCVADRYVVICLDSIPDAGERSAVEKAIRDSGKTIISISIDQMNSFAGNMLEVENGSGECLLVMSSAAFHSLNRNQEQQLYGYNRIVHAPLDVIEKNGGGSARCMMAEIHLPLNN